MSEREAEDLVLQRAAALSKELQRLLRGQGQAVQMAALADIVSVFIAGHVGRDERETAEARTWAMSEFLRVVEGLVPLSAAERGLPHGPIDPDPVAYTRRALGPKQ